jgi:electron transfer flavoprotein alpha subunit
MPRILVVGEVLGDGSLTKLSAEVATLARELGAAGGGDVEGLVFGSDAGGAATELARFLPVVRHAASAEAGGSMASLAGPIAASLGDGDIALLPASADGRDLAGALSAATGRGVLANAIGVRWADGGPVVRQSVFGGKLVTESAFTGSGGIVTIRPNSVVAEPLPAPGRVEPVEAAAGTKVAAGPAVRVVERIEQAGAATSIEDARVIVAGGRGIGGEEGFKLVEQLADALGGAVGATRAAVDSGWINYSQQIGQTGKIVKPQLYLALGISGAIQHKVGMQTADAIVAVNRDPDAPIAEFADLVVVGDLFEVVPAVLAELDARSG